MSALAAKNCVPCKKGETAALTGAALNAMLEQTPGWKVEDGPWLMREFTFKNFRQALAFVNKVGEIAEAEGHHPDILLGWGYCTIKMQTHDIGGLHDNDFIVAAKINAIAAAA